MWGKKQSEMPTAAGRCVWSIRSAAAASTPRVSPAAEGEARGGAERRKVEGGGREQ